MFIVYVSVICRKFFFYIVFIVIILPCVNLLGSKSEIRVYVQA